MRIAITGGTGFIGRRLAQRLIDEGHEVISIARGHQQNRNRRLVAIDLSDVAAISEAFAGCHAVAHCAGINREIGEQTYRKVHVEATMNVAEAAKKTGVRKIVLMVSCGLVRIADLLITNRSG